VHEQHAVHVAATGDEKLTTAPHLGQKVEQGTQTNPRKAAAELSHLPD
jgi:hypothetical protein